MQAIVPVFALCLLIHVAVYVSSLQPDRLKKLCQAVTVLVLAYPMALVGDWMGGQADVVLQWAGAVLEKAPFFMPPLSFLVYLRGRANPDVE